MLKFLFRTAVNHEWEGLMKEKLTELEGNEIGTADNEEKLFMNFTQLDSFSFLEFTIVGNFQVKTFRGSEVSFISQNDKILKIDSDTQEIDTDYSNRQNMGITTLDVDLTDELMAFIKQNKLLKIQFQFEKSTITFSDINYDFISSLLAGG